MGEITGRKVFAFTAGAFGIIIAVNVVMAWQAVHTFPGLEVANGYVASQSFDADRKAQLALGWTLTHSYAPGKLALDFKDKDGKPVLLGDLKVLVGRATEAKDDLHPTFRLENGVQVADVTLPVGKWIIVVDAMSTDGVEFHQRLDQVIRE